MFTFRRINKCSSTIKLLGILLLLGVFAISCKKDREVIVDNNSAPPDGTIPNVVKENYVNKSYISILGRKPTNVELSAGITKLNQNNVSIANRNQMLDEILSKPGYNQRLYNLSTSYLLNNLDTALITQYIYVFNGLLLDPQYASQYALIQAEKTKLELLKASVTDLESNAISIIGLQKRCINNYFYDQINMGTENFVTSMFQNFLYRYPTKEELTQSKLIVDGFEGVIFLKTGTVKADFINIFFDSNNYFEGQVRDLYSKYVFREPTSAEMSEAAVAYKTSLDFKALQKKILVTNEYVGIN